jgi:hypothetical protein
MAENEKAPQDNILLIAQVKVNLLNGDLIDLLPFKHEEDVRAEVNKFIEEWVKTGFLLKGNFLYPWHQVKNVEVVWVKALIKAEAKPYLDAWQMDTDAQKSFWKTRKPAGKQADEKKEESAKK